MALQRKVNKLVAAFKYFDCDPNGFSRGKGFYYLRTQGKYSKCKLENLSFSEKSRLKKLVDSGQFNLKKIIK